MMLAKIRLEDPEFVGEYIEQRIKEFKEINPNADEKLLYDFIKPFQSGIERILFENRNYKEVLATLREIE